MVIQIVAFALAKFRDQSRVRRIIIITSVFLQTSRLTKFSATGFGRRKMPYLCGFFSKLVFAIRRPRSRLRASAAWFVAKTNLVAPTADDNSSSGEHHHSTYHVLSWTERGFGRRGDWWAFLLKNLWVKCGVSSTTREDLGSRVISQLGRRKMIFSSEICLGTRMLSFRRLFWLTFLFESTL